MENGGNGEHDERGQFGNNNNNNSSSLWDMGFSRPYDWRTATHEAAVATAFNNEESAVGRSGSSPRSRALISSSSSSQFQQQQQPHDQRAMMMHQHHYQQQQQQQYSATDSFTFCDGSSHVLNDPNLTCLKLGNANNCKQQRRHNCNVDFDQQITAAIGSSSCSSSLLLGNNGRPSSSSSSSSSSAPSTTTTSVVIPRCQVDGCHVALLNCRGYHKRHKVCEIHSKATRVEILGVEQRFCQQCSRFHAVTEFDDLKRSCRRRLAGHNERRRKNSTTTINQLQDHQFAASAATRGGGGEFSYLTSLLPPRQHGALSLLSSNAASWVSGADYSHESSSAPHNFVADQNSHNVITNQFFVARSPFHQARNRTEDDELSGGSTQSAGALFSPRHFPHS